MLATIIIAGIVFLLMGLVITSKIKKSRKGENGCGCGCSGCASAAICHSKNNNNINIIK